MSKRNYFNKGYWNNIVDCIILAILVILAVCMIIPFYNAVLVSITPYKEYVQQPLYIIPTGFDFGAYKIIFSNKLMYTSILVSIFNSTVGTLLAMFITTITGYALSKKNMPGHT
jgi:putative aldouronate transport system permease protein